MKKEKLLHKYRIFVGMAAISAAFLLPFCATPPQIEHGKRRIDLQGHRGARGLRPENTWPAFVQAYKYKMTTLELDTNLTKDNKLIIHHDSFTNPNLCQQKTGKSIQSQPIRQLSSAYLLQLDCGSKKNPKFPKQVTAPQTPLLLLPGFFQKIIQYEKKHKLIGMARPFFNIELKFPKNADQKHMLAAAQVIVKNIEAADMVERVTVQSFSLEVLPMVKRLNGKIKTSALFSTGYFKGFMMYIMGFSMGRDKTIMQAKQAGADIISPHYSYVSRSFIRKAHEKGLAVIPWTVNKKKEMKRLLSLGVDGIISDYPDLLRRVHDAWKQNSQNQ